MDNEQKASLNLNEKWKIFIRKELKTFGLEHPKNKFEINCWVDDLVADTVHEINDYLAENRTEAGTAARIHRR